MFLSYGSFPTLAQEAARDKVLGTKRDFEIHRTEAPNLSSAADSKILCSCQVLTKSVEQQRALQDIGHMVQPRNRTFAILTPGGAGVGAEVGRQVEEPMRETASISSAGRCEDGQPTSRGAAQMALEVQPGGLRACAFCSHLSSRGLDGRPKLQVLSGNEQRERQKLDFFERRQEQQRTCPRRELVEWVPTWQTCKISQDLQDLTRFDWISVVALLKLRPAAGAC